MPSSLVEYNLVCQAYGNYAEFEKILGSEIGRVQSQNNRINILEIGTGSGITTEIIINSRNSIKLTSIDYDMSVIMIAKERIINNSVEFICIDALEYIKKCNVKFDVIASAFTIHNFERSYRDEFYKEVNSIIKKGGIFINADKYSPDIDEKRNEALQNIIGRYFDVFLKAGKVGLLKRWVLHYIEDQSENKIMKAQESLRQMVQHGFTDVNFIYQEESKMLAVLKAIKTI